MRVPCPQSGIRATFGVREQRGGRAKLAARRGLSCEHSREINGPKLARDWVWAVLFVAFQARKGVQAPYACTNALKIALGHGENQRQFLE